MSVFLSKDALPHNNVWWQKGSNCNFDNRLWWQSVTKDRQLASTRGMSLNSSSTSASLPESTSNISEGPYINSHIFSSYCDSHFSWWYSSRSDCTRDTTLRSLIASKWSNNGVWQKSCFRISIPFHSSYCVKKLN